MHDLMTWPDPRRLMDMYLFYVDESGTLDPEVEGTRPDGSVFEKEYLYVITAVSLFASHWREFEAQTTGLKRALGDDVSKRIGRRLSLEEYEVKSNWLRIPKERARRPFIQFAGTSSGCRLPHVVEMPMFVRSELSNGVQLADPVSYSIYRAFRYENTGYQYFERIAPNIWSSRLSPGHKLDGLKVFPPESPLFTLAEGVGKKIARDQAAPSSDN